MDSEQSIWPPIAFVKLWQWELYILLQSIECIYMHIHLSWSLSPGLCQCTLLMCIIHHDPCLEETPSLSHLLGEAACRPFVVLLPSTHLINLHYYGSWCWLALLLKTSAILFGSFLDVWPNIKRHVLSSSLSDRFLSSSRKVPAEVSLSPSSAS